MVFSFVEHFFQYLCPLPLRHILLTGHQVHTQPNFCLTTQRPFAPASFIYKRSLSLALPAAQQDIQKTLFVIFCRMNALFPWHAKSFLAHRLQSLHPHFKALFHAAD